MISLIEKLIVVVAVILVLSYFVNNGQVDFTWVNKAADITKNVLESDQVKRVANNMKEAVGDAAVKLSEELKTAIKNAKTSAEAEDGDSSKGILEASLVRVIDGDTLLVSINGEEARVRLIGIDTPESVNPNEEKNNEYGELASAHTKQILQGVTTVYLEFDEQDIDIYDRLLAYVWLDKEKASSVSNVSGYMLQGKILADGYAKDKIYEPNRKYAGTFNDICEKAKADKAGLWSDDGFVSLWEQSLNILYLNTLEIAA